MKVHINVLYGIVVVLLILQIVTFASLSSQTSKILSEQEKIKNDFGDSLEVLRQENQFGINELSNVLAEQQNDFNEEIKFLKASQTDFSGVIDEVIRGVVSVKTDKSSATGFAISEDGYFVTNSHVTQGSSFVRIHHYDGTIYDAKVIGEDPLLDIALLEVDAKFDSLPFADSDKVQLGEKVIAIGNPLGLSFTVTEGIVSGIKRAGPSGLEIYIQTDVTLNPGNSGGPLINRNGEVIGMNNFKIGNAEGLGFAIESNIIKNRVIEMLNGTQIQWHSN